MAFWYFLSHMNYGSDTEQKTFTNIRSTPVLYNDILYGLESNYHITTYKGHYGVNTIEYRPTSTGSLILSTQMKNSVKERYGFPSVIKRNTALTKATPFGEISATNISGKYRYKGNISSPSINYAFIPLYFSVDNKDYQGMTTGYNNPPWYASTSQINDEAITDLFGYYDFNSRVYFNKNANSVGLFNNENFDNTNTYENLTYINDDFVGKVFDFGEVAQEIPTFLYTWINNNFDKIYDNYYYFYDYTGENLLASITEIPPVNKILVTSTGTQKIVTLTDVNNINHTVNWNTVNPDNKIFTGLSNVPNTNKVIVPVNIETSVNWIGENLLYESYNTYRPIPTIFDINLYQNSAEVNRVDKEQFLVGVGTLSGVLRDECSIIRPVINYQSNTVPNFNYVYIPIFNRYYFVTSLSSVSKNVWRMELNCDVLMSYKDNIHSLQGVIGRQEIDFNPLLVDNELPTQNNPIVEVIDIPSDAFNTQSDAGHNFLLTVIGA